MKLLAAISLLLFTVLAEAQMYPGEFEPPHPRASSDDQFSASAKKGKDQFPYTAAQVNAFALNWSKELQRQYENIKLEGQQNQNATCEARESYLLLRSLYVFGEFEKATTFASACGARLYQSAASYAALAALGMANQELALGFYRLATRNPQIDPDIFKASLISWSNWKLDREILARNPSWSVVDRKMLYNGILVSQRLTFDPDVTLESYLKFYKGEFAKSTGHYRALLFSLESRRKYYATEDDLYDLMQTMAPQFEDPTLWGRMAYRVLFATPASMFKKASLVYEATLPYLHPRASLPTEDNTKNYSELYETYCKENLLQGSAKSTFFDLKAQWRARSIQTADFIRQVNRLAEINPHKSDLLVAQATFAHMRGDFEQTKNLAWAAHQLCPFYNRAHWVLGSLMATDKYKSYPEYNELVQKMKKVVASLEVPSQISTYIINWNQLTADVQENLIWGLRLWIKFIPGMDQNDFRAYIKFPFEMMYEMPNLAEIKDDRVSYPRDNRLWDDTRGLGGQTIVSDYFESPESPYGNYNLLGHEMAHQVDDYMANFFQPAEKCLDKLFEGATARDVFVGAYSRIRAEYFAVASESYFIPVDYPARFGVQRSWYNLNDPDLARYMEQIIQGPDAAQKMNCQQ